MNKAILSLLGCSTSIAAVLTTSTIANPDPVKTIPYPEVMNLKRVPIFDAQGIVPQTTIAHNNLASRYPNQQPLTKAKPVPIKVDLVGKTFGEAATKYAGDRLGDRTLAPSVMVLGYSSPTNY
jgi:hypothetical protein